MTLTPYAIGFLWYALAFGVGFSVFRLVSALRDGYGIDNPNDFSGVEEALKTLLRQGFDGAYYRVLHRKSGRFLRVRKYIREKSVVFLKADYGLELVFPATGGAEPYVEGMKSLCADEGLDVRFVKVDPREPAGAVLVDFGRDTETAFKTCRSIWTVLFGLAENTAYRPESYDLLGYDELVDSPHFPRPTREDVIERQRRHIADVRREQGKPALSCLYLMGCLVLGVALLVAIIGLPANMLLSIGEPPDWQFQLGGVAASGNSWSLVFFLFHIAGLVWGNVAMKRVKRPPLKGYRKLLRIIGRLTIYTTPIAVIVVWLGA